MTLLDIAQSLLGKQRGGLSSIQTGTSEKGARTEYGTAVEDSSGGFVRIVMDNSPATHPDYPEAFSVSCDTPIKNGDRVSYIEINGVGKAISLGTVGSIATATNQHFWNDTSGVHVAEDRSLGANTKNILVNSNGMAIFKGDPLSGTELAGFSETQIKLGENCTLGNTSGDQGTVSIELMSLGKISLLRSYITNNSGSGGNLYPVMRLLCTGGLVEIANAITDELKADAVKMKCSTGGWRAVNAYRGAAASISNKDAVTTSTTITKVKLGTAAANRAGDIITEPNPSTSPHNSAFIAPRLNLNSYGEAIKCAVDGNVLVSAQVYCSGLSASNTLYLDIYKNSSQLCEVAVTPGSGGHATAVIPPRAVSVSANDYFEVWVKSTSAVTSGIPIGGACLTVQYC